jgi:integrase
MINRANWKAVRVYLKYRLEVNHLSRSSMHLEENWLRHLIEWAGETGFSQAPMIRPTFPEYILSARLDGKGKQLSPAYTKKVVRASFRFFSWIKTHQRGYKNITAGWIDTLQPPRMTIEHKDHEAVTLEEIRAIATAPVYTLRDRRIRAAAVFWFLSGIRIGAFVSLPLAAVDLDNLAVNQWPKLGVRTKFKKHATTYLLDIPDLLQVVRDWDRVVRQVCGNDGLWFAPFSPETGEIIPGANQVGDQRHTRARKDLKDWLNKVGLAYHSPHKFRHGNAVFSLKNAKDVAALKAVSQNLMHSNLSITDGVYGILSDNDVKGKIMRLNKEIDFGMNQDLGSIKPLLERLLNLLNKEISS